MQDSGIKMGGRHFSPQAEGLPAFGGFTCGSVIKSLHDFIWIGIFYLFKNS